MGFDFNSVGQKLDQLANLHDWYTANQQTNPTYLEKIKIYKDLTVINTAVQAQNAPDSNQKSVKKSLNQKQAAEASELKQLVYTLEKVRDHYLQTNKPEDERLIKSIKFIHAYVLTSNVKEKASFVYRISHYKFNRDFQKLFFATPDERKQIERQIQPSSSLAIPKQLRLESEIEDFSDQTLEVELTSVAEAESNQATDALGKQPIENLVHPISFEQAKAKMKKEGTVCIFFYSPGRPIAEAYIQVAENRFHRITISDPSQPVREFIKSQANRHNLKLTDENITDLLKKVSLPQEHLATNQAINPPLPLTKLSTTPPAHLHTTQQVAQPPSNPGVSSFLAPQNNQPTTSAIDKGKSKITTPIRQEPSLEDLAPETTEEEVKKFLFGQKKPTWTIYKVLGGGMDSSSKYFIKIKNGTNLVSFKVKSEHADRPLKDILELYKDQFNSSRISQEELRNSFKLMAQPATRPVMSQEVSLKIDFSSDQKAVEFIAPIHHIEAADILKDAPVGSWVLHKESTQAYISLKDKVDELPVRLPFEDTNMTMKEIEEIIIANIDQERFKPEQLNFIYLPSRIETYQRRLNPHLLIQNIAKSSTKEEINQLMANKASGWIVYREGQQYRMAQVDGHDIKHINISEKQNLGQIAATANVKLFDYLVLSELQEDYHFNQLEKEQHNLLQRITSKEKNPSLSNESIEQPILTVALELSSEDIEHLMLDLPGNRWAVYQASHSKSLNLARWVKDENNQFKILHQLIKLDVELEKLNVKTIVKVWNSEHPTQPLMIDHLITKEEASTLGKAEQIVQGGVKAHRVAESFLPKVNLKEEVDENDAFNEPAIEEIYSQLKLEEQEQFQNYQKEADLRYQLSAIENRQERQTLYDAFHLNPDPTAAVGLDLLQKSKAGTEAWLSASTIDMYINLLRKRCPQDIRICSTLDCVEYYPDTEVKLLTSRIVLDRHFENVNKILVPMRLHGNQWALCEIDLEHKIFKTYHSLSSDAYQETWQTQAIPELQRQLHQALLDSNRSKNSKVIDKKLKNVKGWLAIHNSGLKDDVFPMQNDGGNNSGVFLCKFIESILAGNELKNKTQCQEFKTNLMIEEVEVDGEKTPRYQKVREHMFIQCMTKRLIGANPYQKLY